jgi:crotonobetainyl-CoA:carnitine CoA-transferase CaiB-like acyl-CoA transferase
VQRQTGRHASYRPTQETQAPCADGNYLNTGVPPRDGREFRALAQWLEDEGIAEECPAAPVLALGAEVGHISQADLAHDELLGEIFGAGREAQFYLARRLSAYDAFIGCQARGMAAGAVFSPDDLFTDRHFVARDWPAPVEHPELGRSFTYGGVPLRFDGSPMRIARRAPLLGEHDEEVLGRLG